VRIEWDPPKARANLHAHGTSFVEAATILDDDFALTREDPGTAWKANKRQRVLYEKDRS